VLRTRHTSDGIAGAHSKTRDRPRIRFARPFSASHSAPAGRDGEWGARRR
jgi:hypothetical protein